MSTTPTERAGEAAETPTTHPSDETSTELVVTTRCPDCDDANPSTNAYCGACGSALSRVVGEAADPDAQEIDAPKALDQRDPRWRGPRRTLIMGAVALAVGLAGLFATAAVAQSQGVSLIFEGVVVKILNSTIREFGIHFKIPTKAPRAGWVMIAAFIASTMLTTFGASMTLIGGSWALFRWRPIKRGRRGWRRAQPHVEEAHEKTREVASAAGRVGKQQLEAAKPKLGAAATASRELGRDGVDAAKPVVAIAAAGTRQGLQQGRKRLASAITGAGEVNTNVPLPAPSESTTLKGGDPLEEPLPAWRQPGASQLGRGDDPGET